MKRSLARYCARLGDRDQAVLGELAPVLAETGGARDPEHRLQVAQAARALLDVGLEVVGRVLYFRWRCCCSSALASKNARSVERRARSARRKRSVERARAGEEAMLEQARPDRDVAAPSRVSHSSTVRTLAPISRPMSQSMPMKRSIDAVPAPLRAVGQQDQDVDVGMREELAAAVAADGDAAPTPGGIADLVPDAAHDGDRPARACSRSRRSACRDARRTRRAAPRGRASSSSRQRAIPAVAGVAGRRRGGASRPAAARTPWLALRTRAAAGRAGATRVSTSYAVVGDEHRVLPLRRKRVVGGDDGPAVGEAADAALARR